MKFAYTAYDRAGKAVSDSIDAPTRAEASDTLRKQGLFVNELVEDTHAVGRDSRIGRMGGGGGGGRTKRLRSMAAFVRQLSILVSTGTPIVEAITSLEKQVPEGHFHAALGDIRSRIEQGNGLSVALQHHPAYFDAVARSLVAAGESGGMLDAMLKRLSALARQQVRVRSMIAGAMVYPCLLITVALGVLGVMLFFVLPRFEDLFHTLGSGLPPTTKMLIDLSDFLRAWWWAVVPGIVVSIVGLRLYLAGQSGQNALARFLVRAPHLGRVFRSFATARIARVLGVLVDGKVPLLEALTLARESAGNPLYEELLRKAEERVTRGESVSSALEGSPLIDPSVVEAIRSGERSGQIGPVLLSLAEFMDEDNEIVLKSLSSIVEPLILIVLGVLIGFVAVSMFLPLFDLAGATGAHGGGG
ncbi:MAG TPA: type II secretion system F family protein [Phycisphaerales bacterium]|nr:type II secretion system F family protein [Phycisphaerales bacterium]